MVSIGHSEKAMLAVVSISWTASPTTPGKPWPPYSGSPLIPFQPAATYCW